MARYHISSSGTPAVCHAEKGNCPLGGADGSQNHFDNIEDAQAFADSEMAEEWVDEDHYDDEDDYNEQVMSDPAFFEENMMGSYRSMGVAKNMAKAPEFTKYDTPSDTSKTPGFEAVSYDSLPHDDLYARMANNGRQYEVWEWADGYGMTAYDADNGGLINEGGQLTFDYDKDSSIRLASNEPGAKEYAQGDDIDAHAPMDNAHPEKTINYIKENHPDLYKDLQTDPSAKPFLYAAQHGSDDTSNAFDSYIHERALKAQDQYSVGTGRKSVFEYINNPDKYKNFFG